MNNIKYESMDDSDIHYYLPKCKILKYNELKKYKSIEKLLPKHKSYFILLYPVQTEMSGHWICFTRYDRNIEYFDSYGLAPDVPFSWPTSNFKNNERYLSKLLNKCKLPMVYNTIDFQNKRTWTFQRAADTLFLEY